jgi:hypothetical protein
MQINSSKNPTIIKIIPNQITPKKISTFHKSTLQNNKPPLNHPKAEKRNKIPEQIIKLKNKSHQKVFV